MVNAINCQDYTNQDSMIYSKVKIRIDYNVVYMTDKSDGVANCQILSNVELKSQYRAGIIPYFLRNDKIYFCLGIDTEYETVTDFGGHVKLDESIINAGIREYKEESLDIFPDVTVDELMECPCLYDNNNLIMFTRIDDDVEKYNMKFVKNIMSLNQNNISYEVSNIVWLELEDLKNCLLGYSQLKIYTKVYKLLADHLNILEFFIRFRNTNTQINTQINTSPQLKPSIHNIHQD